MLPLPFAGAIDIGELVQSVCSIFATTGVGLTVTVSLNELPVHVTLWLV